MRSLLLPAGQVGFGVPSGAEAATLAVRRYASALGGDEERVLVKIDFQNAFDTVSQAAVLAAVRRGVPAAFPHFAAAYAEPSTLFFDAVGNGGAPG
jgi:hypothetical protein